MIVFVKLKEGLQVIDSTTSVMAIRFESDEAEQFAKRVLEHQWNGLLVVAPANTSQDSVNEFAGACIMVYDTQLDPNIQPTEETEECSTTENEN